MKILSVLLIAVLISACSSVNQKQAEASGPADPAQESAVALTSENKASAKKVNRDPWEGFNRRVFGFNDFLDRNALKPVAQGYQWITPDPVEHGITNVFDNLREISTIVNGVLQWKWDTAANSSGRFLVNSTVGLVGIFDVAKGWGMERKDGGEDFGQTLAVWGVGSGPYLVLPFFGPSTVRDSAGTVVNNFTLVDPVTYIDDNDTELGVRFLRIIDTRARLLSAEELLSGDRYSFVRDAFLQRRDYVISDGKVEDDFGGGDESYEDFEGFDDIEF